MCREQGIQGDQRRPGGAGKRRGGGSRNWGTLLQQPCISSVIALKLSMIALKLRGHSLGQAPPPPHRVLTRTTSSAKISTAQGSQLAARPRVVANGPMRSTMPSGMVEGSDGLEREGGRVVR